LVAFRAVVLEPGNQLKPALRDAQDAPA